MNKNITRSKYRPEIDGLRAFAVVTVIINHFNKDILPGGYLGVDIFFVISGFVITSSIYQRESKNFKDFISGFYERRIKRLVPALSIFVLITSIATCLFIPFPIVFLQTGLASLFGLSNLYLLRESTDYFAQSTELNAFTHTWSLGVEEQFYIFFPFLVWFSGFGRQTKNGVRNLFLIVGALTIASLISFLYLYPINQSAAYFLMPSRFWEIASGCLLYIGLQMRKSLKQFLEKIPSLLVLVLIIGVMYVPMQWAALSTVAVIALSALLLTSLQKQTMAFTFLTNPKVVYVGLISYSLYLWHWGILSISRWTIGIHWWSVPFQVGLMFGLAVYSHRWIEAPLRKATFLKKRWQTFFISGGLLVSLFGFLLALDKSLKEKLFIGNQYNKWNVKIYGDIKITHSPEMPTVYFLGDSIAGTYGATMTNLADKKKFNLIMHPQGDGLKLLKKGTNEWILAPLREYKNNFKQGDVIIFSAEMSKYTEKSNWTKQYETFIQQTKHVGMKFILIAPNPSFSSEIKNGDTCQEEWYRPSWAISSLCFGKIKKSTWLASNKEPITSIEKFLLANPKVSYIDAFSILCSGSYCKTHDQLSLMYRDPDHLSSYGAMKLSNIIETAIESN